MKRPSERSQTKTPFLRVDDAEIVHGPEVIAEKVSEALTDADRFDLPDVKPPLSEALGKVRHTAAQGPASDGGPAGQDALAGKSVAADEAAGSAEMLKPNSEARNP